MASSGRALDGVGLRLGLPGPPATATRTDDGQKRQGRGNPRDFLDSGKGQSPDPDQSNDAKPEFKSESEPRQRFRWRYQGSRHRFTQTMISSVHTRSPRGAALMAVLWLIAILAMAC